MCRTIPLLLAALVPGATLMAQDDTTGGTGAPPILFSENNPLTLTIEAPLKVIFKEREQVSSYHPGVVIVEGTDGSSVRLDVQVKTRGKFRLNPRNCRFPPLRINFKKKQVENTVFAGQDKLKLVTHCQDKREEYEQYVLLEHVVYRTYNLLTDLSYRVRLARITYVDTEEDREPLTKYAFFIEEKDDMAARNGWEVVPAPVVPPAAYEQDQLNLAEVFQFLVGNTDWTAFKSAPDETECCHNVTVVGNPAGPVYPVPYDFDWTGLVSARYARPDPSLSIRSVRQRLYRGRCREPDQLDVTIPAFLRQKEAIYALVQGQEGLDEKRVEDAVKYLDEFYEIIEDPNKVRRQIRDRCRAI
ncbi:MAG: hypothetical protein JSW71_23595 [Gemmatimonadota bacterium]|nr:MAG: hypothetical protein JSW71_23595 [Gemmatimonadota bacterium]